MYFSVSFVVFIKNKTALKRTYNTQRKENLHHGAIKYNREVTYNLY
nr:MAG TPA: hypothetical protein [Caudoviricetes sp.]